MSFVPRMKIYGERNSGTNYVSDLIKKNLEVELLPGVADVASKSEEDRDKFFVENYLSTLGWKHGLAVHPDVLGEESFADIFVVTISKNPYAWLRSFYKRPYHEHECKSFHEFIRRPPRHLGRANMLVQSPNPIALWNEKCRSYLALPQDRHCHVTYERLIAGPQEFIDQIAERVKARTSQNYYSNIILSTKSTPLEFEAYKDFYLSKSWQDAYTQDDIDFIAGEIDPDLMHQLGYSLL